MASSATGVIASDAPEVSNGSAFSSSIEHLLAELDCLKLLLHRQVLRLRAASLLREDQFRGLYISDEEVDSILLASASAAGSTLNHSDDAPSLRKINQQIKSARTQIAARIIASHAIGLNLSLKRITEIFALSTVEQFILLVCLAPELDNGFEILYSYVQNDVTRKHPTPDLILKLLYDARADQIAHHQLFSSHSVLFRATLIEFSTDAQNRELSLLSRALRPDPRIVDYLLGHDTIDERLLSFTSCCKPVRTFASLALPQTLISEIRNAAHSFVTQGGAVFLHGPSGSGKRCIAEAISHEHGRSLLTADLERSPSGTIRLPTKITLLCREALLHAANLFLAHADSAVDDDSGRQQKMAPFLHSLDPTRFGRRDLLIFISSTSPIPQAAVSHSYPSISFAVPPPDFANRVALWNEAISTIHYSLAPDVDIAVLANKFQLTGGEIRNVCRESANRALLSPSSQPGISLADLEAVARAQSNHGLRRMAQKVKCIHDWSDLVLPPRAVQQLHEICLTEKYRSLVYSRWGFDRRLSQGKGLNVLFCGPSGTGKTMAAGIIALELALDLYRIDLSTVVSKYIGETEKQLSQIFREAQSSNAILFFDEADALFGKRSEVKDAHDRYANIEVAYLLQKMEEYEGIVILATNFRGNIDEAFTRRIHHIVEFPFPDPEMRQRIWRVLIPSDAPLATDVDFGFLAQQFDLAGGNIRNVVLAAAFLAAEAGGEIRMEHFIRATSRELQKLGRMPSRTDFREYFELVRALT
ncbi:MAG: ATP-binding protein [Candidatus Sulfotelmatobacter sp.]